MRLAAPRVSLQLVVALLALDVFASPRLSTPVDLIDASQLAPQLGFSFAMTGAPVKGGFVAAWRSGGTLLFSRLDERGVQVGSTVFALPSHLDSSISILSASDGVDAIVVLSVYGHTPGLRQHIVFRVKADGIISEGPLQTHALTALTWNGTAYIGVVGNSERALEISREGVDVVVTEIAPFLGDDYDYIGLGQRFFAQGPIVSIIRQRGTSVWRAKLTDSSGHAIAARWVPLSMTIARYDTIIHAGADLDGTYLVTRPGGDSEVTVQFLDVDDAPNTAPAVLSGFRGTYVRGIRARDGVLLFLQSGRFARVVRRPWIKQREREHDSDGSGSDSGLTEPGLGTVKVTTAILEGYQFSDYYGAVLLPAAGGAVLIAQTLVEYESKTWSVPSVGRIAATPQIVLQATEVLARARPGALYAAATAHGDGFLVVWQQGGLKGSEIWARSIDSLGRPRGAGRLLGYGTEPKVGSQGDVALVVWTRYKRPYTTDTTIAAIRVDRDAIPIDPAPLQLATLYARVLSVAFDAMQFNVILASGSYLHSALSVVFSPGSVEPAVTVRSSLAPQLLSGIASAPGNTLLVGPQSGVGIAALRHDLTQSVAPRTISVLGGIPRAMWNGENFVVAWFHADHCRYARVSAAGESLDSEYGRVLGNLPSGNTNGWDFEMVARGNQFVIATPTQVAVLREGAPSQATPLSATSIEDLVARPDGAILLVTRTVTSTDYDRWPISGRIFLRMVTP